MGGYLSQTSNINMSDCPTILVPPKLETHLCLASGDQGSTIAEALGFKSTKVDNLYSWDDVSKQFKLSFQERGVAYNETETTVEQVQLVLNDLPAEDRSGLGLAFDGTPVEKWGINFAGVVRVTHPGGTERSICVPGTRTYDPAGITGDPHASERIGPSCSRTQVAITIAQLVAALHGTRLDQLVELQEVLRPLIVRYHGRVPLFDWMFLQIREAVLENKDVTPYPEYLKSLVLSNKMELLSNREHTKAYLQSYNTGQPKPPIQYYKKVAAKDKIEDILEGSDLANFRKITQ